MDRTRPTGDPESGSVLIAVVGIMVVITVLAIGAFAMSDNNLFQTKRERNSAQALNVAEAGLEAGVWKLKQDTSIAPTTFPVTVSGGTASVVVTQTGGIIYRVTSTGLSSTTPVMRRVVTQDITAFSLWDMCYAEGGGDVNKLGKLNGSGSITGSFYKAGDWADVPGQSAWFYRGPFFCQGGNVSTTNFGRVGEVVDMYCDGTAAQGTYEVIHNSVPDFPLVTQNVTDLVQQRAVAAAESADGVQGSARDGQGTNDEVRTSGDATGYPSYRTGTYKVVDSNSVIDTSVVSVTLGGAAASFGHPYNAGTGKSSDDFAWDKTAGVLTVQGTIFIDAKELDINAATYAGKGTIVCSGDIYVNGNWGPHNLARYPGTRGAPTDNVGLVSFDRILIAGDASGAMFASTKIKMTGNHQTFVGEIISPEIDIGEHCDITTTPGMGENLPPGMPGSGLQSLTSVSKWREATR